MLFTLNNHQNAYSAMASLLHPLHAIGCPWGEKKWEAIYACIYGWHRHSATEVDVDGNEKERKREWDEKEERKFALEF